MKVKVSYPMTKLLNDQISGVIFSLEKYTGELYERFVDFDLFAHTADYDSKKGVFKVIKVNYPADCFAMPGYLTTKDLNRIFSNSDHTMTGFIKAVKDQIEI